MDTSRGYTQSNLANTLEDAYGMFEVAYVKDGYGKLDVCIMTDTINRVQTTCFTKGTLLCCSLMDLCQMESLEQDS